MPWRELQFATVAGLTGIGMRGGGPARKLMDSE